ncbi:Acetyltransferase (GNAT) domain-containing protein [Thomasclavelia cocleata]|uniref:Acetyltransferase (GNAT) domain-containing protein n=2 Tax=Thomasclavelia cocleata TaxID=69824 RepID=A0A1I0G622_9FIRM|nr:hypothetical protein IMSAGC017_00797 [Thomasclavelia cocleata]SET65498.1 Acetyltransferase (GNAT) domain-containing protein [Thomasclavelia cocleata]
MMEFKDLDLKEFDDFYKVILDNFPSKEIKEYNYMKDTFIMGAYKVLILKEDNRINGILSYYDGGEFTFIDYFAINGNQKGKGLGSKMLKYFLKMIDKQVILEVEYPEDDQSKRRIVFYQKNGLVLNDHYNYYVPPVRNLKHPLYFHLMSYPKVISEDNYKIFYPKILNLVYGVDL